MPNNEKKPTADDTKIKFRLRGARYSDSQIIDHRKRERGSLWVLSRSETPTDADRKFFEGLNNDGYDFRFVKQGARATGKRPAWYWQPKPDKRS